MNKLVNDEEKAQKVMITYVYLRKPSQPKDQSNISSKTFSSNRTRHSFLKKKNQPDNFSKSIEDSTFWLHSDVVKPSSKFR